MIWRLEPGLRWLTVDAEMVILNTSTNTFVELSGSAAELWTAMNESSWNLSAGTEYLQTEYGLSPGDADKVVLEFVHDLERNGLVTCVHDQ